MNAILPIAIIILLGAFSGLALSRLKWPFLARGGAAALMATVAWCCGCYLFLGLFAPNELGLPLPKPIAMTFLTALGPALLVSWFVQARGRIRLVNN